MLTYLQNQASLHLPFLEQHLQPYYTNLHSSIPHDDNEYINVKKNLIKTYSYYDNNLHNLIQIYNNSNQLNNPNNYLKNLFLAGLLTLLREKLNRILPVLVTKPLLFRHTIDELLVYHTKLALQHNYPNTFPGSLAALTIPHSDPQVGDKHNKHDEQDEQSNEYFDNWLKVEKDYVNDRLDIMRQRAALWGVAPGYEPDPSSSLAGNHNSSNHTMYPSVASEELSSLIDDIKDRFLPIRRLSQRLVFLQELQFKLLRIFLADVKYEWRQSPIDSHLKLHQTNSTDIWIKYCGLLNSLYNIEVAMKEWGNETVYVELQCFKHYNLPASFTDSDLNRYLYERSLSEERENEEDIERDELGLIFGEVIKEYKNNRDMMLRHVIELVKESFVASTSAYRTNGYMWSNSSKNLILSSNHSNSPDNDPSSSTRLYDDDDDRFSRLSGLSEAGIDLSPTLCDAVTSLRSQVYIYKVMFFLFDSPLSLLNTNHAQYDCILMMVLMMMIICHVYSYCCYLNI